MLAWPSQTSVGVVGKDGFVRPPSAYPTRAGNSKQAGAGERPGVSPPRSGGGEEACHGPSAAEDFPFELVHHRGGPCERVWETSVFPWTSRQTRTFRPRLPSPAQCRLLLAGSTSILAQAGECWQRFLAIRPDGLRRDASNSSGIGLLPSAFCLLPSAFCLS